MRLYINVFFYLSVSIKMNYMVKIVGADPCVRPRDRNITFNFRCVFVC